MTQLTNQNLLFYEPYYMYMYISITIMYANHVIMKDPDILISYITRYIEIIFKNWPLFMIDIFKDKLIKYSLLNPISLDGDRQRACQH